MTLARSLPAAPAAAPVLRVAMTIEIGRIGSSVKAKTTSACCQPSVSIRMLPIGGKRNWPKEPAAVPAPKAIGRHCSGRSLPKAASTRLNEQAERPKPISTPAPRWSWSGVVA